jgi:hypothetical protein
VKGNRWENLEIPENRVKAIKSHCLSKKIPMVGDSLPAVVPIQTLSEMPAEVQRMIGRMASIYKNKRY